MHDISGVDELNGTQKVVRDNFDMIFREVLDILDVQHLPNVTADVLHDQEQSLRFCQVLAFMYHDIQNVRCEYIIFDRLKLPENGEFTEQVFAGNEAIKFSFDKFDCNDSA